MCVRKILARALPLTALGLAAWCPAYAVEEPVKADDVYVTATRVEKELQDVPMSVSVMTSEDIKRSPARTIGELLQDVPGVEIRNSGGQGFKRISIRGENPNRVLILIDGQKLVENKSMDGTPLLIDRSTVERVEVIKGPASVLYGSEAIGGVVNIITKKGGDKPIQGEASVAYNGASNGFAESLSAFGGMNGFKYRVSGSYSDQGNLRTPDGEAPNTSFRQKEGSAFLSYDFSDKFTVGGGLDSFKGSIHSGSMEPGYENFSVEIPEWKRDKVNLFAEARNLTEYLARVRFDAFWQESRKHMINTVDVDGMPIKIVNDADNINRQTGAGLQTDWQMGDSHYLVAGYDYNHDALDADTLASGTLKAMGMTMYRDVSRHEGSMDTHAFYAQMESVLPYDFTLNYGMRYTWVETDMDRAEGTRTSMGSSRPKETGSTGSTSESRPVFNFGLVWTGIDDLALRATFSQGFRVANLQERYVLSSMGGGTINPNADVDPETSNNYELGARYDNGRFTLDAALFYNDAKDYIDNVTIAAAADISEYRNVSSAKTRGLEIAAQYAFDCCFTPFASLTWMKRKFDSGSWETYHVGDPTFTGRAGLRYERALPKNTLFHADAYARFANASRDDIQEDSGISTITYGGWTTANFAAGIDFGSERQYSVTAEVLNIFDKTYQFSDSVYEPGLHANLKFSWRF